MSLTSNPKYTEGWGQNRIAEDPSILGSGNWFLSTEKGGNRRLAVWIFSWKILKQNADTRSNYNSARPMRRIVFAPMEYWDIERKRYPKYDHCAVLVAEDVTSRFLNVVSLFNGEIPLMAIQMQAIEIKEHLTLVFTTVMNELTRGDEGEDTKIEQTDRTYWEKRGAKETVSMVDNIFGIAQNFLPIPSTAA